MSLLKDIVDIVTEVINKIASSLMLELTLQYLSFCHNFRFFKTCKFLSKLLLVCTPKFGSVLPCKKIFSLHSRFDVQT